MAGGSGLSVACFMSRSSRFSPLLTCSQSFKHLIWFRNHCFWVSVLLLCFSYGCLCAGSEMHISWTPPLHLCGGFLYFRLPDIEAFWNLSSMFRLPKTCPGPSLFPLTPLNLGSLSYQAVAGMLMLPVDGNGFRRRSGHPSSARCSVGGASAQRELCCGGWGGVHDFKTLWLAVFKSIKVLPHFSQLFD